MLDPSIFQEAKVASARKHLTIGYIIEEALIQYLKLNEIRGRLRREFEQNQRMKNI